MKSAYAGKESLEQKIAGVEQRRQEQAAAISNSYMESIIRQVDGSMAIEGMTLTDEDKSRIRNFAFDSSQVKNVVAGLVKKHSIAR